MAIQTNVTLVNRALFRTVNKAVLAFLSLLLVACVDPVKDMDEVSQQADTESFLTTSPSQELTPVDTPPLPPITAPEAQQFPPNGSQEPGRISASNILSQLPRKNLPKIPAEVTLLRKGQMLKLSGTLNSSYQIADIVSQLTELEFYLNNQLLHEQATHAVVWGNNIAPVLTGLASNVDDLQFKIKGSKVTIIGKVSKSSIKKEMSELIIGNLEGTEISEIDNQLK